MRDLLAVLGIDRATLVGHSLGAGVIMQFAYQYPERTERLVPIAAGGVSQSVTPALRVASLPGAQAVLSLLGLPGMRMQTGAVVRALLFFDHGLGKDAEDLVRLVDALPDATSRSAFIRTLRAVVDWRGQVVTMLDRCYLTAGMPTLLLWGSEDMVVPVEHARVAHEAMPDSRLEVFDGAGHFPFHNDPAGVLASIRRFLRDTDPARWNPAQWRKLLRRGRTAVSSQQDDEPTDRSRVAPASPPRNGPGPPDSDRLGP